VKRESEDCFTLSAADLHTSYAMIEYGCECVCGCVYVYTCIYIRACVRVGVYLYICVYIYEHICTLSAAALHAYQNMMEYVCVCGWVYICIYMYICTNIYTHIHIQISHFTIHIFHSFMYTST